MTAALGREVFRQSAGWQASLAMNFAPRPTQQRTVMESLFHRGPLRIQRPFHPEGDLCHVYVLHPPGGVVGGDGLRIDVGCLEQAHALVTTPGATKFYRSAGDTAQVSQCLCVAAGASLEWLPQENIFFPGARVSLQTDIHLAPDASLIAWEINCLGRPVIGERFTEGALDSRMRVFVDQQPRLIEHQKVASERHLSSSAGLRGAALQGMLVAWRVEEEMAQAVQEQLKAQQDVLAGATLLDVLLVVRALGSHAERLRAVLTDVWRRLRPAVIDRPTVMPRIWAT